MYNFRWEKAFRELIIKNLICCYFLANFLNITHGLAIGWFINYAGRFLSNKTPLAVPPILENEVRWVDASVYIGAFLGTILYTLCGDIFGRKFTLMTLVVPQGVIISFDSSENLTKEYDFSQFASLTKMLATNDVELYIGSLLSGFSVGGSINLVILLVAELADDRYFSERRNIINWIIMSMPLKQNSRSPGNDFTTFNQYWHFYRLHSRFVPFIFLHCVHYIRCAFPIPVPVYMVPGYSAPTLQDSTKRSL